jgi:hypothetical protein
MKAEGIPLAINELMASNSSCFQDPQGQYDDWIEIYNYGSNAINMGGMYLTDDLSVPTKWCIPDDRPTETIIPARGYLLIWADEDTDDDGLHANFKLDAEGEEVALFDSDGAVLIDNIIFGNQTTDISFGRYPDADDAQRFFGVPSPAAQNHDAYLGVVEAPEFSHARGFYDTIFYVTLTTETEGATIYYTLNGSRPYDTSKGRGAPLGTVYTGPIRIATTTCLRAEAIKHGFKPHDVVTHTYIFPNDVLIQPDSPSGFPSTWGFNDGSPIPADYQMDPDVVNDPLYSQTMRDALLTHRTLSLVLDLDDLFDPATGIYANSTKEGPEWERPVSVEFIDSHGGPEIQVNAGLRIQGSASRNPSRPKHNLRLLFKGTYGPTKLEYPVFENWPVETFDTLILRGSNGDSWFHPSTIQQIRAQYIRDLWPRDTQHDMGRLSCGQGYVHLYINGLYWGLYHTIERPNASFFAEHLGGEKEDYDVVQHKGGTVDGNRQVWNTMMQIANAGLARSEAVKEIEQYLDIDNLIDFLLVNFFMGNVDWDHNNWYGGRKREPGAGFKFFTWDSERTFLDLDDNVTGKNNPNQPTHLHYQLMANADYRMRFADHVHKHFFNGGALTPEVAAARWMRRADEIALALSAESARWGDNKRPNNPYTPDEEWREELNFLITEYFPQRTNIVLNQLKAHNLYPNVDAPVFRINGSYQHGGLISAYDVLSITAQRGTIWYTFDDVDPRQSAISSSSTSTTLVAEDADKWVFVPTGPIGDNWKGTGRFNDTDWLLCTGSPGGVGYERGSGYQDLISLDVEELMFGAHATCYIRIPFILNSNLNGFDFMTLRIRYDDGFIAYLNNVEVARRNFEGTPAWNSNAGSGHSDSEAVEFENIDISAFLGNLRRGNNLFAIHGLNVSTTSSDLLFSFELIAGQGSTNSTGGISPNANCYTEPIMLEHSANIKARVLSDDTWSALNEATFVVGPVAENLRITEIMYHPQALDGIGEPNEEFIELTNIGTEAINLNLVCFTNGIDFTFPNIQLTSGEYIVVVQDRDAFESRYGTDINIAGQYTGKLNNAGERIKLQDAIGQTILDFSYNDSWYSLTDGEGFSLTIIDPANPDLNSWNMKDSWCTSTYIGGSPCYGDSGIHLRRD